MTRPQVEIICVGCGDHIQSVTNPVMTVHAECVLCKTELSEELTYQKEILGDAHVCA